MFPLRTQAAWLAVVQPNVPRGFALGKWFALLVLMSAGLLGTQGTASAGCGNALGGAHAHHGSHVAFDAAMNSAVDFVFQDPSQSLPVPCNGPNCGKQPQRAPAPVSTAAVPKVKILGCPLGGEALLAGLAAGPMFARAPQAELSGYPLRIERPPTL